ncbi:hypothetical protein FP2506_16059 [Fulvimarina pelagi HTCC2506]|uniref:Uncharacterized protein n=1 Tax=Fulvimarina pelagi HTCC2506 TaxID=314231 RepID=Q0G368_9HYPH|nr:hypothetical protein FP2506_16059 [Fulvimarina pelagi HTCC2506]
MVAPNHKIRNREGRCGSQDRTALIQSDSFRDYAILISMTAMGAMPTVEFWKD